ncbi:hypothetical protein [Streptomyces apocyni]|uniref:hypothetical protein n=1 Tax=Streptomyces apocyni TaxID=2654677 RepID=UPI0012E9B00C|nr:hypothetical protein [Streptomyces apocyni]
MRPARNASGGRSATPIYDELFAEWRRSFKALPGDRSGEDNLGFTGFGSLPYGDSGQSHGYDSHSGSTGYGGGYGAHSGQSGSWYVDGRQPHTGGRLPAALPPAPRRGR